LAEPLVVGPCSDAPLQLCLSAAAGDESRDLMAANIDHTQATDVIDY